MKYGVNLDHEGDKEIYKLVFGGLEVLRTTNEEFAMDMAYLMNVANYERHKRMRKTE